MTSIMIDRTDGLSSATAIKGPCRVATTANITLYGEQTIDGVAVVTDDRVLVKNQTAGYENGIYVVDTGQWRRSKDFNKTRDVVKGTRVAVTDGTIQAGWFFEVATSNPIVIGTTSITFNIAINPYSSLGFDTKVSAAAANIDPDVNVVMVFGSSTVGDGLGSIYIDTNNGSTDTFTSADGRTWYRAPQRYVMPSDQSAYLASPAVIENWDYRWPIFRFDGAMTERAKGSGHATADFRSVIQTALGTGEKIEFPAWVYPIRSNTAADRVISVTGDFPIDVECAKGARFLLGAAIDDLTAGVFSLQTSTMPSMTSRIGLRWEGGIFDASELVDTPAFGLTIFDIFQYTGYSIRNVQFYAGTSTPSGTAIGSGKCDGAITTHNCFGGVIDNCDFVGFYDQGVYLSGNNAATYDMIGEAEVVQNSRFRRCLNGINMKRDQQGHHILNNFFFECGNGILASPADSGTTNHGETSIIIGNRFKKIQGRPIFLETGKDFQVKDNTIIDFGKLISDGTTFTTVSSGNRCAGIDGRDVSFAMIEGNDIRMDDWAGGTADANKEPVGLQLLIGDGAVGSFDNILRDNYIYKVHRTMLEGASCDRNKWIDNDTVAPTSGTALAHSIAGANSQFIGQILMGSVTNDPASIAAGGNAVLDITLTGAAIGDIVAAYSFSRDAASTQLRDLNVKFLTTTDKVQVVLLNNTAGALDLGNTTFTVWIRKAK